MKKTRFFQLASLLLFATGCSQEEFLSNSSRTAVISAVMENVSSSRSHATDEGKFTWTEGDKLSVYTSKDRFATFTLQGESGTSNGTFTGTLSGEENIAKCAVYPQNDNHKIDGNTLTYHLPAEYGDYETEYVANTYAPMLALTDGTDEFHFKHLGGVLRLKLDNVPAGTAQIEFTVKNLDITGDFDVDLSKETPTISARSKSTANSVTIKFKPLETKRNDMVFFIPLPVGIYDAFGLYAKMEDGTKLAEYWNGGRHRIERKMLARYTKELTQIPIVITGESSVVAITSASFECTYMNFPDGAECGVEYAKNYYSYKDKIVAECDGDTEKYTLTNLSAGTEYKYRAYMEIDGKIYYGEEKTFTTKHPDITGDWICTQYISDEGESFLITINSDGTVTQNEYIPSDNVKNPTSWYQNPTGMGIRIMMIAEQYATSQVWFSGEYDNVEDPQKITGTLTRSNSNAVTTVDNKYKMIMNRITDSE